MITRLFFLLVLGGFLGTGPLCAQADGTKPQSPTPSFQVMALGASPLLADLYYMRTANDAVPLTASPVRLSPPVPHAAAGGAINLALKRAETGGKTSYVPVARVAWPEGGGDKALVFISVNGSGSSAKVQAVAVDHSLKAFPGRSLRVVNFSGGSLFGHFAGFKGEILPGLGKAVPYPQLAAQQEGATPRFPVALGARSREGEPAILFNGWSEAWANARTLIVVTPGDHSHSGRPKVRFVVDNLPTETATKG